jgi:hypothetical protein
MQHTSLILSIGTITVSILALFFAFLNNREQREVQLQTTIQKEWVEKVRALLADMLRNSIIMADYKQRRGDSKDGSEFEFNKYVGAADEFQNKLILLSVYLNFKNKTEKDFYELLGELRKNSEAGNLVTVNTLIRDIQLKSQELFNNKYHK